VYAYSYRFFAVCSGSGGGGGGNYSSSCCTVVVVVVVEVVTVWSLVVLKIVITVAISK
jgi:hypothetical protein